MFYRISLLKISYFYHILVKISYDLISVSKENMAFEILLSLRNCVGVILLTAVNTL